MNERVWDTTFFNQSTRKIFIHSSITICRPARCGGVTPRLVLMERHVNSLLLVQFEAELRLGFDVNLKAFLYKTWVVSSDAQIFE